MKPTAAWLAAAIVVICGTDRAPAAERPELGCRSLTELRLPDLRIVRATLIEPKPVWQTPPVAEGGLGGRAEVRERFCRVEGTIEDEIAFELWLPEAPRWNGRLLGLGNGGFAGFFRFDGLAYGVNRGYASVSTDTGHQASELNWPLGHPRRLENYGHRATHLVAVDAKAILGRYYSRPAAHHYFVGCSGGGMQAMNEVQRYPADYDGIIAGAHGQSIAGISARWLADALITRDTPAAALRREDWQRIADTAVRKCDAADGATDGIISNPARCRFDPAETPGLSTAQIETARRILGPVRARDGATLFPAFPPGVAFLPLQSPGQAGEMFAVWGHDQADWDLSQFEASGDMALVESKVPGTSFTNPNLSAFQRRGGKLISWHGTTDQIVPMQSTVDYYDSVRRFLGAETTNTFYRLYLPVGVNHCGGGAGPDNFGIQFAEDLPDHDARHDVLAALVAWVENGQPPGELVASRFDHGQTTLSRPLCPYPQVVKYRGRGEMKRAESFQCTAP